jgi:hypothetical protein
MLPCWIACLPTLGGESQDGGVLTNILRLILTTFDKSNKLRLRIKTGGAVKTSSHHQARLELRGAAISRPADERIKQQKQTCTFYLSLLRTKKPFM